MTKLLGKIKLSRKNNSIPFYLAFTFLIILLIASCSKPAGLIGVLVQPEDSKLKVGYTDTVSINAYAKAEDSVRTDELSICQLGSNMDPVFGHTTAGMYLEFMLEEADHSFGPNAVVDSLVLYLLYSDTYGDTNQVQIVRTYEILERMDVDSAYYSNLDLETGIVDFSNFSYAPQPSDSFYVDTASAGRPPMQKIYLMNSPELGEKLLAAPEDAMEDNDAFKDYFNGLYLVTDPVANGGSIVSYDVFSNYSEMILYYHNDDADSLSFDYTITLLNATANKYQHDHTMGDMDFQQQIVGGDTSLGKQNIYLQGLGGVASVIKFPFIKEWSNLGAVSFNEAKLILSGVDNDTLWGAPNQLSMAEIQDDGTFGYLNDQIQESEAYFGGEYNSSTHSYTFRITRYIQSLVSDPDKNDNGLYLITTGASIYPNRFIFNGYQPSIDTTKRLKLELLYTDLD